MTSASPTASSPDPDRSPEYSTFAPLFTQLAASQSDRERSRLRDQLITGHLDLAAHIARRFAGRGEPYEDLLQVARFGLVKAVDRFDPGFGTDFLSFAVPTVMGEIRKYFRDASWSVHMPRRLKERYLTIGSATSELTQTLGRPPTPTEIAGHLGIPGEEVREGLQAAHAYKASSLDQPARSGDGDLWFTDTVGADDPEFANIDHRESLHPLIAELPARERTILLLRFFGNMTQSQIADRVGISQMHVSRLLSRTLQHLRSALLEEEH